MTPWMRRTVQVCAISACVMAGLVVLDAAGEPFSHWGLRWILAAGPLLLWGWLTVPGRGILAFDLSQVVWSLAGIVALTGLTASLLHSQLAAATQNAWSRVSTRLVVGLALASIMSAISLAGAVHELQWILRHPGRIAQWAIVPRRGALRLESLNNMKQYSSAILNLTSGSQKLPAGGTFGDHGEGMHGWITAILPALDMASLFRQIDRTRPWNDPVNRAAMATKLMGYPGHRMISPEGYGTAAFAANVHVLRPQHALRFEDITDGQSTTILIGEAAEPLKPWGHPFNLRDPRLGLHRSVDSFGGPWDDGTAFVMCDGSIRTFSAKTDPRIWAALNAGNDF